MSIFEKLERACAAFIERSFAKTFPSDLEPAQIARKLVSTMEAGTRGDEGQLVAPGWYVVYVNPEDFERLAAHRTYLEREWAQLLAELAARVGIVFSEGGASVKMSARPDVPAGTVDVAAGAPRSFSLRMIKGVSSYGVYSLEGSARIGRADECDVLLADPSVSRAHAILETAGDEPTVRDLGSTNGTFVNGERVESKGLRDGDELRFGNTRMQFEIGGGEAG
ncbi:MAG: FhaA domain-containing protein [Candidatus Tumulicola sp.]